MTENTQPAGAPAPAEQTTAPAPSEFVDHDQPTEAATEEAVAEPQQAEAEPTEEATTDEQVADGEETPSKPKREPGSRRLKRELQQVRAELAEARSRIPAANSESDLEAYVEKLIGKAPDYNDEKYKGDYLKYERDALAHQIRKDMKIDAIREQNAKTQSEIQTLRREQYEDFLDREVEFRKKAPDYDEVRKRADTLQWAEQIKELLVDSEKGPDALHYLTLNPTILDALNKASEKGPAVLAREFGKIEERLNRPPAKKATQASKPPAPLKGGAAPTPKLEDMPMDQYVKYRQAENKRA